MTDFTLIIGGVVAAIIFVLVILFVTKYTTVGKNEALIVTGSLLGAGKSVVSDDEGKKVKIIHGGGAFIIPVMQQARRISLENHKLEVGANNVYSKQGVPVSVNGNAIIKIGSSVQEISTAAEQYIGKYDDLKTEARQVLEGHLRAILSSMTVEEINSDREVFAKEVQKVAATDLSKMGLRILSFTTNEVSDKNGYLDALGQPQIAAVKRDAAIARAEREKEARIENARAEQEAKAAEYTRDAEIANSQKEKELKVAEYRRQQEEAKAQADQAYSLQEARAQQKVTEEKMQVNIIERQKQIELEEKEIQRRERQYDAEVKKKADAERYAVEQEAEAQKAKELRAAEAERERGRAEADVILSKGLAEAEAKEKIAEAFSKYGQAAMLDMITEMLPEYAKQAAQPLGNIDKITVVDTGGSGQNSGANKVTGYATNLMGSLQESLKASSGLDMKELIESFAGKGNVKQSIDNLSEEMAAEREKSSTATAVKEKDEKKEE
ncbi:flotillin [Alteribacter lacisalsi]|uniref:Flotillin n=1 Tax=Alteribacter lacisalsi TaxID=2045244 RepID=A0A2W0HM31_9BACI|nr:flotillin family protein [Alteribacter lacisalsi]PYZ98112.1 flotillin [Alteribacter lacisalsi]